MSLNIKREETCRLAAELSALTGENRTEALTVAARERLERIRRERDLETRLRKTRAIAKRCASLMGPGPGSLDHGDWLYDERGLPK